MEGILDMSKLLMELIAERLKQPPIPLTLLHILATVRWYHSLCVRIIWMYACTIMYVEEDVMKYFDTVLSTQVCMYMCDVRRHILPCVLMRLYWV